MSCLIWILLLIATDLRIHRKLLLLLWKLTTVLLLLHGCCLLVLSCRNSLIAESTSKLRPILHSLHGLRVLITEVAWRFLISTVSRQIAPTTHLWKGRRVLSGLVRKHLTLCRAEWRHNLMLCKYLLRLMLSLPLKGELGSLQHDRQLTHWKLRQATSRGMLPYRKSRVVWQGRDWWHLLGLLVLTS